MAFSLSIFSGWIELFILCQSIPCFLLQSVLLFNFYFMKPLLFFFFWSQLLWFLELSFTFSFGWWCFLVLALAVINCCTSIRLFFGHQFTSDQVSTESSYFILEGLFCWVFNSSSPVIWNTIYTLNLNREFDFIAELLDSSLQQCLYRLVRWRCIHDVLLHVTIP